MKKTNTKELKDLSQIVETKEQQMLKERQRPKRSIWHSLGMFGLVGWSIVVPTILGIMLGRYLDKRLDGTQSWTLTFLIVGLISGCAIAWFWLSRENREIHREEDKHE